MSQRFSSVIEACDAFEQNRIIWTHDHSLRRVGEQMELHRSLDKYRPTYIKLAEANGAPIRTPPWIKPEDSFTYSFPGPRCIWPGPLRQDSGKIEEATRERRGIRCLKTPSR